MISRILMMALIFVIPLSAVQPNKKSASKIASAQLFDSKACAGCNSCRQTLSAAELLLILQGILNNNLLLLPGLQDQLLAQLTAILTGGGGGGGGLFIGGQYAYIYNLLGQTIAIEADVPFDSNGLISPGISHAPSSSVVSFTTPGVYEVTFSVSGTEPNQFALFLNGALIPGSIYGSGAGTQQNTGQVIFRATAGDVLTLRNHSSSSAVGLATPIGGTQASVNASLFIEQLAP